MYTTLQQFAHFSGVGFISAMGHYGLLVVLVQCVGVAPIPASVAGALLGAGINYLLNYRFTFRSTKRHRDAVLKFAVIALACLLLNTIFMWLGIELLRLHYLISQIITTGLVLIWSFLGNRYWTFHVTPVASKKW
ncbi:MAG: GtrA family protein [Gallionella sp.]|nr:GtrA family protein [Gallionella sp.]